MMKNLFVLVGIWAMLSVAAANIFDKAEDGLNDIIGAN